jgi:hypothetical protein
VWSINIDEEPPTPANCITLYDTPGIGSQGCMDRTAPLLTHPSFQVRVRGKTFIGAHTKLMAIDSFLRKHARWTTADGTRYDSVTRYGEPGPLGKDDTKRFIWVATYITHRKED